MHKVEPLGSDRLSTFDRLVPKGGILTNPKVKYIDVNDISKKLRLLHRNFFSKDLEYKPFIDHKDSIYKGTKIGKKFCAYVYKDLSLVGSISFTEYLDSPFGFRKDDFVLNKWIYPEYRRSKYSRYALGHLIHLLLESGVANNLYSFPVAKKGTTYESNLWASIDTTQPCHGEVYPCDSPDRMKYFKREVFIQTPWKGYILTSYNGEVFRRMDRVAYLMSVPDREEKDVKEWLQRMSKLSEVIRRTVYGPVKD